MATDIGHFLEQRGLTSGVNLLGHSMCVVIPLTGFHFPSWKVLMRTRGGKAVMAFALNENLNGPLRSLISVDMSPAVGKMSPECAHLL